MTGNSSRVPHVSVRLRGSGVLPFSADAALLAGVFQWGAGVALSPAPEFTVTC